jgi:hypothetical protein
MCHHTSPSMSGHVARGRTAAKKKPTIAAVAAAMPGLRPEICVPSSLKVRPGVRRESEWLEPR